MGQAHRSGAVIRNLLAPAWPGRERKETFLWPCVLSLIQDFGARKDPLSSSATDVQEGEAQPMFGSSLIHEARTSRGPNPAFRLFSAVARAKAGIEAFRA